MNGRLENEIKIQKRNMEALASLPHYVTEWYYNLKASEKTESTCRDFINKVARFLEFANGEQIDSIVVERYMISIQTKTVDGSTVRTSDSYRQGVWCCLNNFFSFLVANGYVNRNPMNTITKSKNRDLDRINRNRILLTKEDFKRIIMCAEKENSIFATRNKIILKLFMNTGMRKTALSEINVSDIDFQKHTLMVTDKGDKEHEYYLPADLINDINMWKFEKASMGIFSDALFVNAKGERLTESGVYKLVSKCCEKALGYHVSPHKLRSGFCSILYDETGDMEFVRRAVGHSNISTTQRYIVTRGDERERASSIISSFLS